MVHPTMRASPRVPHCPGAGDGVGVATELAVELGDRRLAAAQPEFGDRRDEGGVARGGVAVDGEGWPGSVWNAVRCASPDCSRAPGDAGAQRLLMLGICFGCD